MSPVTRPLSHPRRGQRAPDVLPVRAAHRATLRTAGRLTSLSRRLCADASTVGSRRAGGISRYVLDWADSVHRHHVLQRELLWPLLLGSAGRHVDLSELDGDHAALVPLLERLRCTSAAFGLHPEEDTAAALELDLVELHDALAEHVAEEEALVLPLAQQCVSARDWDRVQALTAARSLPRDLARARSVLTPHEWRAVVGPCGPLLRLRLVALAPTVRRQERHVFGR